MKNIILVWSISLFILESGCQHQVQNEGISKRQLDINEIKGEEFEGFYKKFISDSTFQMQRISFPLVGVNTDEMEMDDTIYYWQSKDWKMYRGIPDNIDTTQFIIRTDRNDSIAIDEVALKDASFGSKYVFKIRKGKWQLVRYEDINL